jgi:tRNA threonylcarbamoyl adenosine modification protein YeaZ
MRILVLDTSLEACSVGILDGEKAIERTEIVLRGHAEKLFGMVESTMAEAGLDFADLDRIAVTVGPGSFTGVRIGVAAARGFALVTGRPAVGLSTLAAHAESARRAGATGPVVALLTGRGGEVSGQLFAADGAAVDDATQDQPEHFAALARRAGASLAGSGADAVAALDPALKVIHRRSAPELTSLLAIARDDRYALPPKPIYLRPPDAVPVKAPILAAS